MASNYRAIVHYQFKKGMEEQGIKFLDHELVKKGQEYGCHYIEIWQNERDHSIVEGVAIWEDLKDAKRFQSLWEEKEKELIRRFCKDEPSREFCKIRATYMGKSRKAA